MIPSRKLAVMFLCVFLLGAVAGALVLCNVGSVARLSQFFDRTSDPASLAQRVDKKLAAQYSLSADEQANIAPLTQEMAQNVYQLRLKFAHDVLTTMDASHEKIGAQMTAEHRAAYAKDNIDRHNRTAAILMPSAAPAAAQ